MIELAETIENLSKKFQLLTEKNVELKKQRSLLDIELFENKFPIILNEGQPILNEEQQNFEKLEKSAEELRLTFPLFVPLPRVQTEVSFRNEKDEITTPMCHGIDYSSIIISPDILINEEHNSTEQIEASKIPRKTTEKKRIYEQKKRDNEKKLSLEMNTKKTFLESEIQRLETENQQLKQQN